MAMQAQMPKKVLVALRAHLAQAAHQVRAARVNQVRVVRAQEAVAVRQAKVARAVQVAAVDQREIRVHQAQPVNRAALALLALRVSLAAVVAEPWGARVEQRAQRVAQLVQAAMLCKLSATT